MSDACMPKPGQVWLRRYDKVRVTVEAISGKGAERIVEWMTDELKVYGTALETFLKNYTKEDA